MTALLLLAVLVLVLLNGVLRGRRVRARARRARSHRRTTAEEGNKRRATAVLTQIDDLSRYLAACQVGITLTSLGIGFLGEPAIGSIFEDLFGEERPALASRTASRSRSPT